MNIKRARIGNNVYKKMFFEKFRNSGLSSSTISLEGS